MPVISIVNSSSLLFICLTLCQYVYTQINHIYEKVINLLVQAILMGFLFVFIEVLKEYFCQYGTLNEVNLKTDGMSGRSR